MAKVDEHRALVAAHLAVVRRAADLSASAGAHPSPPVEAAIALVERWVTEGGVTSEALQAVAQAAWDDGDAHRSSEAPTGRSSMWLGVAAGNLASMARRERGWKDAPRTILDAATYALSSLRVEGLPGRSALEALAAEVLAAVPPSPARVKTPGPPRPRRLGATPELGELASAFLARRKPVRDPRAVADRATLVALLEARRLPISEAALAFEERYGGTRFSEDGRDDGSDFMLGPFALLRDDAAAPGASRGLIPIVLRPSDIWYFVDAAGAVWGQDTIEDPEPMLFAMTTTTALARMILNLRGFEDRRHGVAECEGERGVEWAAKLGLPAIAEASDPLARFWGDAQTLIIERAVEGGATTLAVGRAAKRLGE